MPGKRINPEDILGVTPGPPQPCTLWPIVATSEAQARVNTELTELLQEGSPFRSAVLLVSYLAPDGDSHIAHGSGMQMASIECAQDFFHMVKALRQVADHLDSIVRGTVPPGLKVEGIGGEKP